MDSHYYNKKAQSNIFLLLMLGITFIVLALALAPGLRSATNESMNTTEIDCFNDSISDQNKAVCTSLDVQPFLFMVSIVGLAGLLLLGGFR